MSTKRIKISFSKVNEGKFTAISANDVSKTNIRIKKEMKDVVRKQEVKQALSLKEASRLVLNF